MIARCLLALALALLCAGARAETLVVSLSTDLILVTQDFAGTNLALFGVIERDAQTVARPGEYEIAVVVRGPAHTVLVQQKERRFGIWVNSDGLRFPDFPSYYGLFTTPADHDVVDLWLQAADDPHASPSPPMTPRKKRYFEAIARQREQTGMFRKELGTVEMLSRRFFRTLIPLPGVAEDGDYTVTAYLFAGGVLLDEHELGFRIAKVGLEQTVFELSRNQPILYGLGVVLVALVTGYVGGVVFRRN